MCTWFHWHPYSQKEKNLLQKNFENIFAGINPDDLSGLLKSLNNEQITEEGIVKAYMNQSKPGVNDDSN